MESMRHLSTSLPRTRRQQDQSDLLTDFKAAALSVTNLYKSAAADQVKARSAGYQDALDDLLTFLDRENLGLMDGEGWRVRQWATERLVDEMGTRGVSGSEDEEESGSNNNAEQQHGEQRGISPEVSRKPSAPGGVPASLERGGEDGSRRRKSTSEPPQQQHQQQQIQQHTTHFTIPPSSQDFSFRAPHSYPQMDLDAASTTSPPSSTDTIRVIPRPSRSKHTNHNRRSNNTNNSSNNNAAGTLNLNLNLGSGAGNKRRLPYSDFFDISGLQFEGQEKREGGGRGGKKARHA